jgi:endonuclease/exonuclease/phosphatase family metal-dependent hydrolase
MAFNVENLFDTIPDPGKQDQTFLPKALKGSGVHRDACLSQRSDSRRRECLETDWTDETLKTKLMNVAEAIRSSTKDGRGPDVLLLSEVENARSLRFLNQELGPSSYTTEILIEGRDERGIDPAILSRLPLLGTPQLHEIPFRPEDGEMPSGPSRGLLHVQLKLPDQSRLHALALHFPSQANPHIMRRQAVAALKAIVAQIPTTDSVVVGGDFNITRLEDERTGLFSRDLSQVFQVSHLVGCKGCLGTHYYHPNREWSFLDAVLVRGAGWVLDPASVRVPTGAPEQVNRWGSPKRFEAKSGKGTSDHFPVYVEIVKPSSDSSKPGG